MCEEEVLLEFLFGRGCLFYSEDMNSQEEGGKGAAGLANSASIFLSRLKNSPREGSFFLKGRKGKKKGKRKKNKTIQAAHSFNASQVILGHSSCLMGSLGWL